jgi:putative chitinase
MPTEHEISMLRAARNAGITSREEMANFMGQMGHESGGFTRLEEGFRYTRGIQQIPVQSAWREGEQALEAARQEALQGRPQELGRLMYGNRMGNDDAGDGYLYRGRGYTQLTGEDNYRAAGTGVNLDLVNNPALAAERGNAERIAIWFWQENVPQRDRDDVSRATQAINGGTNGLADRHNRYDAWHAVLTPEFVTELDAGRVQPGAAVAPAVGRPAMEDGALRRLETGDDARRLNDDLRALDVRADRNREVPAGDTFTRETEQAIRRFQEQQNLPITGRADPATLEAVERAREQQRQQQPQPGAPAREGAAPDGAAPHGPQRQGSLLLDDRNHPNHDMYARLATTVGERDANIGRAPDQLSTQLAGGLTATARERGLQEVGFAQFSPDGNRVYMTDTRDPSAPWAKTAVGDVAQSVHQPLAESSERVAQANQAQAQEQSLMTQQQTQQQGGPVIQGPRMV